MMTIIGFSGKKQSGKTTAILGIEKLLVNIIPHHVNFADALKKIVATCFGATNQEMVTEEGKRVKLPCGKSIREVLQLVGTDWFRSLDSLCWVRAYKLAIGYTDLVITADVRFPNEVKCIQDLGGHVIRFLRAPFDDQHESETALDEMEEIGRRTRKEIIQEDNPLYATVWIPTNGFDAIVDNRNMTVEQQNEVVWKLITQKGWLKDVGTDPERE